MSTEPTASPEPTASHKQTVSPAPSRRIDILLSAYGETHSNIVNRLIHWFCVPVIAWSILALLWSAPFPAALSVIPGINWAWVMAALVAVYYAALSLRLALGLAGFIVAAFFIIGAYSSWGDLPLWQLAIALFVSAWVLQFIGHRFEGRQTPFPKCLHLLAIGPAWVLSQVFTLLRVKY